MFDADTTALIASAPPLDGLDLADLPQRFTNAYASIVAARVRLRDAGSVVAMPEELAATISELKRVASSHEALVSALPERENRAAAAFVAGTAHYVCLMAERLVAAQQTSAVSHQAISSDVAATVLFLVAEASADAAEMAKSIDVVAEDIVEQAILVAIRNLANGQLRAILQMSVPQADQMQAGSLSSRAVRALYFLIFNGIRSLASSMLGFPEDAELLEQDASSIFEQVKKLSADPIGGLPDVEERYGLIRGRFIWRLFYCRPHETSKRRQLSIYPRPPA